MTRTSRILASVLAAGAVVAGGAAAPASATAPSHHTGHWTDYHHGWFHHGWFHHRYDRLRLGTIRYGSPDFGPSDGWRRNGEWVSVVNTGRRPVQLRGVSLTDNRGHQYRFHWEWLPPHQEVRVHTGFGVDRPHHVFQDRRHDLYDNVRGRIVLRDRRGYPVDACHWSPRDHGIKQCLEGRW